MAKHRLDLLPLLDVFMVVLFVFATLQEQQLEQSNHSREQLAQELRDKDDGLQQAQRLAQTQQASEQAAQQSTDAASQAQHHSQRQAQQELTKLRNKLQHNEDQLQQLRRATESALTQLGANDDELRRQDVLSKLLDRYSVFEIEISGTSDPQGPVNRCCYRTDPLQTKWHPCGSIPNRSTQYDAWLAADGSTLASALRRTKGGNAMTIIRQDTAARYRVSATLAGLLRTRFEDHQVYDDGATLTEVACQ